MWRGWWLGPGNLTPRSSAPVCSSAVHRAAAGLGCHMHLPAHLHSAHYLHSLHTICTLSAQPPHSTLSAHLPANLASFVYLYTGLYTIHLTSIFMVSPQDRIYCLRVYLIKFPGRGLLFAWFSRIVICEEIFWIYWRLWRLDRGGCMSSVCLHSKKEVAKWKQANFTLAPHRSALEMKIF